MPVKWAAWSRLRPVVDRDRVVARRAAESVAYARIHRVGGRSGIDEQRLSTERQRNRESSSVSVRPIQISASADVERRVAPRCVAYDDETALRERLRPQRPGETSLFNPARPVEDLRPGYPHGFFLHVPRCEIRPVE